MPVRLTSSSFGLGLLLALLAYAYLVLTAL